MRAVPVITVVVLLTTLLVAGAGIVVTARVNGPRTVLLHQQLALAQELMMADEIVVAGATAVMNAIASSVGQMSWPELSDRIRGVLTRRGRAVAPDLDGVLSGGGDDAPDNEVLEPLLHRLTAEDLTAIRDALGQPAAHTEINQYGDKNAVNSGPGTQNVTFN